MIYNGPLSPIALAKRNIIIGILTYQLYYATFVKSNTIQIPEAELTQQLSTYAGSLAELLISNQTIKLVTASYSYTDTKYENIGCTHLYSCSQLWPGTPSL